MLVERKSLYKVWGLSQWHRSGDRGGSRRTASRHRTQLQDILQLTALGRTAARNNIPSHLVVNAKCVKSRFLRRHYETYFHCTCGIAPHKSDLRLEAVAMKPAFGGG